MLAGVGAPTRCPSHLCAYRCAGPPAGGAGSNQAAWTPNAAAAPAPAQSNPTEAGAIGGDSAHGGKVPNLTAGSGSPSKPTRGTSNQAGTGGGGPRLPSPEPRQRRGEEEEEDDDDEECCPTCLEGYTADNPQIWTRCGHHFHIQVRVQPSTGARGLPPPRGCAAWRCSPAAASHLGPW
jgi:hypothetical protein